jgi:NAD kinase
MDRIVIVTKRSRLEELVREHLTEGAAQFILESRGQSIGSYKEEDAAYKAALAEVRRQVPNDLPVTSVSREDLPNFLFRDKDLIVVCGPDGLFANLAKYVGNQPILTVNPDPGTVAGVLMLFPPNMVGGVIAQAQNGKHQCERLPFVKASIDEDRVVLGINDLFIGRKDHVSARYEISFDSKKERQSSSGIIVSTGVGSTGWMRSVATMISGLTREGTPSKLSMLPEATSNELVFVVREPFSSPNTEASLVTGRIIPGQPLTVSSEMPNGGYIFSDGIVEKAVEWKAGSKVVVSVGDRYVQRIIR